MKRKIMKKLLAFTMAAAMFGGTAVPAFAEQAQAEEVKATAPILSVSGEKEAKGVYVKNPGASELWVEIFLVTEEEEPSVENIVASEWVRPGKTRHFAFDWMFSDVDRFEEGDYTIVVRAIDEQENVSDWVALKDFTVVLSSETMESTKVGEGSATGCYYFMDLKASEWSWGKTLIEYTFDDVEVEETIEYLHEKEEVLYLDTMYLDSIFDSWKMKEAYVSKIESSKEQVQVTRYIVEQFEMEVYEEPVPKQPKLEFYSENGKVVGVKATNESEIEGYVSFSLENEDGAEWVSDKYVSAMSSEIIYFSEADLSYIYPGTYRLKAQMYDGNYMFCSDWTVLDYEITVKEAEYTGGTIKGIKVFNEKYGEYNYYLPADQLDNCSSIGRVMYVYEDGFENDTYVYLAGTAGAGQWRFYLEEGCEVTALRKSEVSITESGAVIYLSVVPKEKISITEVSAEEEPGNVLKEFSDVYQDWYTEYVQHVFDHGMMTGIKGTDRFEPNANITKAQLAQVLYNLSNQPQVKERKVFTELKDVYEGEWYADAVAWAYNEGIVTGDLNTKKFEPNENVTREQLALMICRYAELRGDDIYQQDDLEGLKNAESVSNWALNGVKWAVAMGLISGIEKDGVKDLAPQGNATRAQVAAILARFTEGN